LELVVLASVRGAVAPVGVGRLGAIVVGDVALADRALVRAPFLVRREEIPSPASACRRSILARIFAASSGASFAASRARRMTTGVKTFSTASTYCSAAGRDDHCTGAVLAARP
jgi:hypothetical protein